LRGRCATTRASSNVPGILWGELRSLATQKQGNGGEVYLFASGQFQIEIQG
jgi:hypothetical protein